MKFKFITTVLSAAMLLLSGCKKDDPAPDKATLSVSPQTAIAFTAAATETFYCKGRHQSTGVESRVFAKLVQGRCGGGSVYGFRRSQYVGNSSDAGGDYGDGRE